MQDGLQAGGAAIAEHLVWSSAGLQTPAASAPSAAMPAEDRKHDVIPAIQVVMATDNIQYKAPQLKSHSVCQRAVVQLLASQRHGGSWLAGRSASRPALGDPSPRCLSQSNSRTCLQHQMSMGLLACWTAPAGKAVEGKGCHTG